VWRTLTSTRSDATSSDYTTLAADLAKFHAAPIKEHVCDVVYSMFRDQIITLYEVANNVNIDRNRLEKLILLVG